MCSTVAKPGTSAQDTGPLTELAHCLGRHFSTPARQRYATRGLDPPHRLVYLLDHEYTQRGLSWERLKGADAERAALLHAAAGQAGCESVLALWLLLVSTGLRRGEALGLTWSDVDLNSRQLRVRRNLQRVKGRLVFGTPKTARLLRTIALLASCVARLRERREQQVQERAEAGMDWQPLDIQPDGLVFTTLTGTALDPRNLNRSLAALCAKAKLRPIRVHDLRHTCASLMLAEGVAVRTIMETLGHSTISMTLNTYAHIMETTLREAADRMDDALGCPCREPHPPW
ncbi:site-specific integrase [Kitasatospora cystarginea]